MALGDYNRINWAERLRQYVNRIKLTLVGGTTDTYDVEQIEGTVTQPGTPISSENMNKMDAKINELDKWAADTDEKLNTPAYIDGEETTDIFSLPNSIDGQFSKAVLKGRTYTNVLDKDGRGDSIANWVGSLGATDGTYLYNTGDVAGYSTMGYNKYTFESNAYYFISVIGKTSATSGNAKLRAIYSASNFIDIDFVNTGNVEVRKGVKWATGIQELSSIFPVCNNGNVLYFRHLLVVKITEEEYNNLTVEELLEKYPYVDGTTGTGPKRIKVIGRNLWNSFNLRENVAGQRFDYLEASGFRHDFASRGYSMSIIRKFMPGTYTIKLNHNLESGKQLLFVFRKNGYLDTTNQLLITFSSTVFSQTVTIGEGYNYLVIARASAGTAQNVTVTDIQLLYGDAPIAEYVPYQESIVYTPEIGNSLPDGRCDKYNVLEGTKIQQIGGSIISHYPERALMAPANGTWISENIIGEVGFYDGGLSVSNTKYPIKRLDYVHKVDPQTGAETPIDLSTCTVAGNKLSFTSTALSNGDLVSWDYEYDSALSTIEETEYEIATNIIAQVTENTNATNRLSKSIDNTNKQLQAAIVEFDERTQPATDSKAGIVELATNAEARAGTDATRAMTPAAAKYLRQGLSGNIHFSDPIGAGATLNKDIPIGPGFTHGFLTMYTTSNLGIMVFFNTNNLDTKVTGVYESDEEYWGTSWSRRGEGFITDGEFGSEVPGANEIHIKEIYISGSNIHFEFENTAASSKSLGCDVYWEVW